MRTTAKPLPVEGQIPRLVNELRSVGSAVLVAPPGSGKSTRVPPSLLAADLLPCTHPVLVMLQPRRVAARAVAERIAWEQGWELGREVGYHVRFERRTVATTRLRIMTEGILTRQLLADPFLDGIGAVVLDEFHERSIHSDLALAWLREIQQTVRPDLKILVMSATLDAQPVSEFLGGCPILDVQASTHPVTVSYAPAAQQRIPAAAQAAQAVAGMIETEPGPIPYPADILVFLPGASEIRTAARLLAPLAQTHALEIRPLHGSLPLAEQDRALARSTARKVILSTNIAETSLTIDGVTTVIDTGLARFAQMDMDRGIERLELGKISRASADQRAGRAGRQAPGRCVRLWSEREHQRRPPFETPEICRVDLAAPLLAIHAWGCRNPQEFGWFESPPVASIEAANRLLTMLGALDFDQITPLGQLMLQLPVHPRIARLLIAASAWGVEEQGIACASVIEEKDVFLSASPAGGTSARSQRAGFAGESTRSDLEERIEAVQYAEAQRFSPNLQAQGIDAATARRVVMVRDDLSRVMRRISGQAAALIPAIPTSDPGHDSIDILPLMAYPDRVCRRRENDPSAGVMVGGRGVRLDPSCRVREGDFFVAIRLRDDRRGRTAARETRVQMACAIEPDWLMALSPEAMSEERVVRFEPERGRAIQVVSTRYFDLAIREQTHGAVDPELAAKALAQALVDQAESIIRSDPEASALLNRITFLRDYTSKLPDIGPEVLVEILTQACAGRTTLKEVREQPLSPYLTRFLGYEVVRMVQELAPEFQVVPSGSRIPILYEEGKSPSLAVRLQELFGWQDTPRIAGGRVPLLLQILGPNYRPVQLTSDLRSFWTNTYHQVRKDLRGRYPKHDWPEDPWTARPSTRPRRPKI